MRLIFWVALTLCSSVAFAADAVPNHYVELLDDPFPSASAPFPLSVNDYEWKGTEKLPTGSQVRWIPAEVQWTRISERLVLPRARVRVEVPGGEGAMISVHGRHLPLRREGGREADRWVGDIAVPLISSGGATLEIHHRRNSVTTKYPLTLVRSASSGSADLIGLDASCSPAHLELKRRPLNGRVDLSRAQSSVAHAHCRLVRNESDQGLSGTLDILFWIDGAGDRIRIDGNEIQAEAPSIFRVRLDAGTPTVTIDSATGESFLLTARVPHRVNRGFFGVGLGPYRYRLLAPDTDISTTSGVVTVYGSYHMTESVRLTAFNATTLHRNFFTDTGFYVKSDSARFFDQRITVYLMLGANMVGFRYGGRTRLKGGAPQGFEAMVHDFLRPNRALIFGAFIYPPIDGKSYYNTWIRYGGSAFFGEINYLSIRDRFDERPVASRSLGVSVGFPLARFF